MKWNTTFQGGNFDEKGQRLILPSDLADLINGTKIVLPYYDITYINADIIVEYFFECRTDPTGDFDQERKISSELLDEKRAELEALGCEILHSSSG